MLRPVHDVENVVDAAAFWVALVVAAVGVVFVWVRVRRGAAEPGVAIAVAIGCLVGLRIEHRLPAPLVVGVVLLALGEWLARDQATLERVLCATPGAVVLGAALPDGWALWIRVLVAVAALVGGVSADGVDRVMPRVLPLLLAIGAGGVYFCVPDTEAPKALLGALLAGTVIALEPRLGHALGQVTLTGLFVWVVAYGGVGRPGSVVGGIGCLGVVLLISLVRWRRVTSARIALLVVTQCALVAFESRVAGFEHSAWSAVALSIPAFVLAAAVLLALAHERGVGASAA
jgi:hypothetical protein